MDSNNLILSKVLELEKAMTAQTGETWSVEDLTILAQIRLSNDKGEETQATLEVGKCRVVDGDLSQVKIIGQRELEARIKEVNSKTK